MDKLLAETKFFIHDLRVDKFIVHLLKVHEALAADYEAAGLTETLQTHRRYMNRLQLRRDRAHEARRHYEVAVKSREPPDVILEAGRKYIDATLDSCRIALLPHWRDFKPFVEPLPEDAPSRRLENAFNDGKNWVATIDRRIVDFLRSIDREVPYEPLPVAEVIRRAVNDNLRYFVRRTGRGRLEIRLGRLDPGYVYADEARFLRLLFNLVMNACDAMKQNRVGVILVEVESTDLIVNVHVVDEGIGMSPEKVDKILHGEEDLRGELHSLGFRFVRQTIKAFKGKIYVESEVGKGTRIRIAFPRYEHDGDEPAPLAERLLTEEPPKARGTSPGAIGRTGAKVVDDFCRSLAPMPGCLFSLTIDENGEPDHFAHRPYDPDWMMGHDDLEPMLYECVFRGRYETDEVVGSALILKSPHKLDEYLAYREIPASEQSRELGLRMIHDEYIRIARHLIDTGMEPGTMVYITNLETCFKSFGQSFSGDPFPLEELAAQALLQPPAAPERS